MLSTIFIFSLSHDVMQTIIEQDMLFAVVVFIINLDTKE